MLCLLLISATHTKWSDSSCLESSECLCSPICWNFRNTCIVALTTEPFYREAPPLPSYQMPGVSSPGQIQMMFRTPGLYYNHRPPWNHPRPQVGSSNAFNYPPNFSNRGIRPGSSPYVDYGPGRGPRYNHSPNLRHPYPNTGRTTGRSQGNYRGACGGRGAGSRKHFTATERPYLYYRKEMTEDPWKQLTPVVRKSIEVPLKSWLPASIRSGKPKVVSSGEAFDGHIPQQSLARLLASPFDENDVADAGKELGI